MRRDRWGPILVLGFAVSFGTLTAAQPLPQSHPARPLVVPALSLTGSCYPIDFSGVDIEWYARRGIYQLTVTGVKPYTNMEVSLSHEAYNGRPAYWRTLVIGCVKNVLVMPIQAPYNITMPLDRFVGTKGVEIVGASRLVRRAVPRS